MNTKKILIVGSYDPPGGDFGGLSVQTLRLQNYLDSSDAYRCTILNIGQHKKMKIDGCVSVNGPIDFVKKLYALSKKHDIIHLITNGHNYKSWLIGFLCALAGVLTQRRTLLTFGSGLVPEYIKNANFVLRLIISLTLRASDKIICRNQLTKQSMILLKAKKENIDIVSGFMGVYASDIGAIPPSVETFLKDHHPVVGAHAFVDPEYGLLLLVEAFKELRSMYPQIGLVIMGTRGQDSHLILGYEQLKSHLLLAGYLPPSEALAVIQSLDVFIRATYFDGDSNSVREALALGVPVVASNTDFRPDGVRLFEIGQQSDLIQKISEALEATEHISDENRLEKSHENLNRIIGIYNQL